MYFEYPFTAIAGQEQMKRALLLNAVNPNIGGVLIFGEKGTAKSTAVRALAGLLPPKKTVAGCRFGCEPEAESLCPECMKRLEAGEKLCGQWHKMSVVELPVGATEDRVVGTLDLEQAILSGEKKFEPGLLAKAHRNILYADEVNLLDDHVVDVLLDAAAMGVNTVEREGISYTHASKFVLVGTMNPEEGDLRPQLLDRFALSVEVRGEKDAALRAEVIKRRLEFEADPQGFVKKYEDGEKETAKKIQAARKLLPSVSVSDEIFFKAAKLSIEYGAEGHRSDIVMIKTAKTLAAFEGRSEVSVQDLAEAAMMALPHRMRRKPFEDKVFDKAVIMKLLGVAV